jgi:serine/threonine-protein kinase
LRSSLDDGDGLTAPFESRDILGTADYIAPEQASGNIEVEISADIYSLGATLYFLLAGRPPFPIGTPVQKVLWHQMRQPTSLRRRRPELPEELVEVVERMMAKRPAERYQTPAEVVYALGRSDEGRSGQGVEPASDFARPLEWPCCH